MPVFIKPAAIEMVYQWEQSNLKYGEPALPYFLLACMLTSNDNAVKH